MKKIIYATGAQHKIDYVSNVLKPFDLEIIQEIPMVDEIQGENYLEIAIDKAKKVFAQIQKPLFITDTAWEIPALNGFPGPYMKSLNVWFSAQDFLDLMQNKSDQTIFAVDNVVYIDQNQIKTFQYKIKGEFADKIFGGKGNALGNVIKFNGIYLAEIKESGKTLDPGEVTVWKDFAEFVKAID